VGCARGGADIGMGSQELAGYRLHNTQAIRIIFVPRNISIIIHNTNNTYSHQIYWGYY